MKKLVIKVVGVIFNYFLIYLFYSPRLKFDVLENPNKGNKVIILSNLRSPTIILKILNPNKVSVHG